MMTMGTRRPHRRRTPGKRTLGGHEEAVDPRPILNRDAGVCQRIVTLPQPDNVGICWFIATLASMFYSAGMRSLLTEASKTWAPKNAEEGRVYARFKALLDPKILGIDYDANSARDILDQHGAEAIIDALHDINNEAFPKERKGRSITAFVPSLFDMMFGQTKVAYYYATRQTPVNVQSRERVIYPACFVKSEGVFPRGHFWIKPGNSHPLPQNSDLKSPADVVVMHVENDEYHELVSRNDGGVPNARLDVENGTIKIGDVVYIMDALAWSSFTSPHAIAGITCGKERYIYNGWKKHALYDKSKGLTVEEHTARKARNNRFHGACPLQKIDWTQETCTFAINDKDCDIRSFGLDDDPNTHKFCYNPYRSDLFYYAIRKDKYEQMLGSTAASARGDRENLENARRDAEQQAKRAAQTAAKHREVDDAAKKQQENARRAAQTAAKQREADDAAKRQRQENARRAAQTAAKQREADDAAKKQRQENARRAAEEARDSKRPTKAFEETAPTRNTRRTHRTYYTHHTRHRADGDYSSSSSEESRTRRYSRRYKGKKKCCDHRRREPSADVIVIPPGMYTVVEA